MPGTAVDIVLVIVVAVISTATGWCLRSGRRRRSKQDSPEVRYTREVLERLHELAAHVAADVGEHTSRVEEINEELLSSAAHETEAVVSAVDRLLEANQRMQQQLTSADEKLQEQAHELESKTAEARTDALTGLANRRAFDAEMTRRLAEFQRYRRTFSMIMLDVDHFKKFNDTHGHQAGDAVLIGLAEVLRENAREMDLAVRYGGEEFAVVLPDAPAAEAAAAADRIRAAIDTAEFDFQGTNLHVTASVGVAELLPGEHAAELIRRADAALYAAKQAGRNCIRWHDGREIHPLGGRPHLPRKKTRGEYAQDEPPKQQIESSGKEQRHDEPAATSAEAEPAVSSGRPDSELDDACDRATFDAGLDRRLAQGEPGSSMPSVVLVRIDDFAKITSDHGRRAGELILQAAQQLLNAAVSDMELLGRYDAATFAALLPRASLAATLDMVERLRGAVASCSLPTEQGQLRFTVSLGAAAAMDGDDTSALMRHAAEALDAAVKSDGNCGYFHNGQWSEMIRLTLQETR